MKDTIIYPKKEFRTSWTLKKNGCDKSLQQEENEKVQVPAETLLPLLYHSVLSRGNEEEDEEDHVQADRKHSFAVLEGSRHG